MINCIKDNMDLYIYTLGWVAHVSGGLLNVFDVLFFFRNLQIIIMHVVN